MATLQELTTVRVTSTPTYGTVRSLFKIDLSPGIGSTAISLTVLPLVPVLYLALSRSSVEAGRV